MPVTETQRIMQVFRAPVGGLFRHVRDLVKGQAELGHEVGIICDATSGGETANAALKEIAHHCSLGVHRIAMSRMPGLGDAISARRIAEKCRDLKLDIIHGHGAKGGAYARLTANRIGARSIYTPHGGTLHYDWSNAQGAIFLGLERYMLARTHGLAFVCKYERETFDAKIGINGVANQVVYNGLWPEDFGPIEPEENASDLLFIGELRRLKGVDVLIDAVHLLNEKRRTTLTVVGDGADRSSFEDHVAQLGLEGHIKFAGALPATKALTLGKTLVVPSRAESFPYVVLEAAAAERTVIASRVGGIPEIIDEDCLVEPDNATPLAARLHQVIIQPETYEAMARARTVRLKKHFDAQSMAEQIVGLYERVLDPVIDKQSAA